MWRFKKIVFGCLLVFIGLQANVTNCRAAIYTNQVAGEFRKKVEKIAGELGINPDYLVATMALETAKPSNPGMGNPTFDPTIENPQSHAVGLIQFMPDTARGLGTTTEKLKNMDVLAQLDWVEKDLMPYKGRMNSLVDVYLAVLYPAAIGKSDDFVLPDWAYKENKKLDVNGDGKISKGEIAVKVQRYYDKGANK